jgi:hypothetical protein
LQPGRETVQHVFDDDEDVHLLLKLMQPDDIIAVGLSGKSDLICIALSKKAEEIGAQVYRIRYTHDIEEDEAVFLAKLVESCVGKFRLIDSRERDMLLLQFLVTSYLHEKKYAVRLEQHLRSNAIGIVFCEGNIAKADESTAKMRTCLESSKQRLREIEEKIKQVLERIDVYNKVFEQVEGCDHLIAAQLISAIHPIESFDSEYFLKKFIRIHKFLAHPGFFWEITMGRNTSARETLFMLSLEFEKLPESRWGKMYSQYMQRFRQNHPAPVRKKVRYGVMRRVVTQYTDEHIESLARWRTISRFVEWLFLAWKKAESDSSSQY